MLLYVCIVLIVLLLLICINYFLLYKQYKNVKSDISKLYIAFKRIRYGDVNLRVQSLKDKDLEQTVNRLIETIYDREMMIKEYQSTLSKKNLSLEEIIKHEKQLRLFKEDFAATLAHDMKVPVIAELNSINYLLEGRFGVLNDKQTELLKLMQSSNSELKELIENMLETYKLDQNEIKLNITKNNINNFIESTVSEMTPISIKNGNKIQTNLKETKDTEISFDEFQLKRVIKNIIQNAISFSPANSVIEVYSQLAENEILIHITNAGVSISKEDIELIFKKYYSGHSKFKKAGTGLGLYLAQQIMLAHNGNISVDTEQEGKTTFTVALPIN